MSKHSGSFSRLIRFVLIIQFILLPSVGRSWETSDPVDGSLRMTIPREQRDIPAIPNPGMPPSVAENEINSLFNGDWNSPSAWEKVQTDKLRELDERIQKSNAEIELIKQQKAQLERSRQDIDDLNRKAEEDKIQIEREKQKLEELEALRRKKEDELKRRKSKTFAERRNEAIARQKEKMRQANSRALSQYKSSAEEEALDQWVQAYQFVAPVSALSSEIVSIHGRLVETHPQSEQGVKSRRIGLLASVFADQSLAQQDIEMAMAYKQIATSMLDLVLGLTPGVGLAKDVYEAVLGQSLLTGEDLTLFDRSVALFGVVTVGFGSKIVRGVEGVVRMAKATKVGGAAIESAAKLVEAGLRMGARTKSEFIRFIEASKRLIGNELGALGEIDSLKLLSLSERFGAKTEVGRKVFSLISRGLEKLPEGLEPKLILEGTDPTKIAIIGRKMGGQGDVIGVRDVAKLIAEETSIQPAIFEPSKAAWDRFNDAVKDFRKLTGNDEAWLPDHLVRETEMYHENLKWIKDRVAEGYSFVDLGNPNGEKLISVFYEMETGILMRGGL